MVKDEEQDTFDKAMAEMRAKARSEPLRIVEHVVLQKTTRQTRGGAQYTFGHGLIELTIHDHARLYSDDVFLGPEAEGSEVRPLRLFRVTVEEIPWPEEPKPV